MKLKHPVTLAMLALLIVLLMAMVLDWSVSSPEPVYNGKPLDYWLRGYNQITSSTGGLSTSGPSPFDADAAVRALGTNAVPTIIRMLKRHDPAVKIYLIRLAQRWTFTRSLLTPAYVWNREGMYAVGAMGPAASNAVPALLNLYEHGPSAQDRSIAIYILQGMGPAAKPAIPAFLRAAAQPFKQASNGGYPSWEAADALKKLPPEIVVPELIKGLQDPDAAIRATSLSKLKEINPAAAAKLNPQP